MSTQDNQSYALAAEFQAGVEEATTRIAEYLNARARQLRTVEPNPNTLRIADALEAEARRIRRGVADVGVQGDA